MIAAVFPGQGAQKVGMGKALADTFPVCRTAFAGADAALGEPSRQLVEDATDDALERERRGMSSVHDPPQRRLCVRHDEQPELVDPVGVPAGAGQSLGDEARVFGGRDQDGRLSRLEARRDIRSDGIGEVAGLEIGLRGVRVR